ncbi:MAG: MM0924 family protein [Pyrinomonadaceae bacterium]
MEGLLKEFVGKKIDVNCGPNAAFRGEVVSVETGLLKLVNEDGLQVFVSIDKIAAVSECNDPASRPGFII